MKFGIGPKYSMFFSGFVLFFKHPQCLYKKKSWAIDLRSTHPSLNFENLHFVPTLLFFVVFFSHRGTERTQYIKYSGVFEFIMKQEQDTPLIA